MITKHRTRSADYRSMARNATALAEASVLERVRERHEAAASAWTELAESEDRQASSLSRRLGQAMQARSAQGPVRPDNEKLPCPA